MNKKKKIHRKSHHRKDDEDSSTDDEASQWIDVNKILRVVQRDDPTDPFKPFSFLAVSLLAEQKPHPLNPEESQLLQNYAADLDICTPYDKTEPPSVKTSQISRESRFELAKLPAWMRVFIESKFDSIHHKYGHHTHLFLRALAKKLEYRKIKNFKLLTKTDVEEHKPNEDVYEEVAEYLDKISKPKKNPPLVHKSADVDPFDELWLRADEVDPKMWSPLMMQRATDALKAVLVAGASDSEGEAPGEGEWDDNTIKLEQMRNKRKTLALQKDEELTYKGPHWEDVVAEKQFFAEKARWEVGLEFTPFKDRNDYFLKTCWPVNGIEDEENKDSKRKSNQKSVKGKGAIPPKGKKHQKDESQEKKQKSKRASEDKSEDLTTIKDFVKKYKNKYFSTYSGHPLYRKPQAVVEKRAKRFRERGVGKIPSRIYYKDPCRGFITGVERELHQVSPTEGFHAYINFITNSAAFRSFILFVIFFNAVLLAAETGENNDRFQNVFDLFDMAFLSIYLVEFMLKCYSNPVQYFNNGFNLFDFVILVVSLIKAILEWGFSEDIIWLRWFVVIRALRILRGVGLSIHTQVLIAALMETLKHHVLSVVILLVLLMYIAAIVAFYLFSDEPGLHETWSSITGGMLRLFAFVTMDGWTEILEEFRLAGFLHQGRVFCFICIVIGNFLFSNIFIAIIIMQISEATDSFRKRVTDERESSVFLKQEAVFRRQKLDMRQLLARHKLGVSEDFYELGSKFVRRLRHDDLVDNRSVLLSPLWMDSFYKAMQRAHHTSNIMMTLHRKMSDRLVRLNNLYQEGKYTTRGISRARYNRYLDIKARLAMLKNTFLEMRKVSPKAPLRVRLPNVVEKQEHSRPPPTPPPMPKKLWREEESEIVFDNQM